VKAASASARTVMKKVIKRKRGEDNNGKEKEKRSRLWCGKTEYNYHNEEGVFIDNDKVYINKNKINATNEFHYYS
jgi:hypothetical protein